MINRHSISSFFCSLALPLSLLISCTQNNKSLLTAAQAITVKDSVIALTDHTAKDISAKGPIAWLNYFENSPNFFMASDGDLAFKDYISANTFIKNTLIHQIQSIKLSFSSVRIDPMSEQFASIGASFHEDITGFSGKAMPFDGYFTAIAHQTPKGWKYLNMHWSIRKVK